MNAMKTNCDDKSVFFVILIANDLPASELNVAHMDEFFDFVLSARDDRMQAT